MSLRVASHEDGEPACRLLDRLSTGCRGWPAFLHDGGNGGGGGGGLVGDGTGPWTE